MSISYCLGDHVESAWLQLPDYSVLLTDYDSTSSERYIPALKKWIVDSVTADSLWSNTETGGSLLLPDGRGFFFGGGGHTAYYTPSGGIMPGSWRPGPDMPNGTATDDSPAAMMMNGKILCLGGPKPVENDSVVFHVPDSFYIFDYTTNSFSQIAGPAGLDTDYEPNFVFNLLDLPDGSVMLSEIGSQQYYIYTPTGTPLASGKPTIDGTTKIDCNNYTITGKLFNGISQGVSYGDDFQQATNFPIVRLTSGSNVYYARNTIGTELVL